MRRVSEHRQRPRRRAPSRRPREPGGHGVLLRGQRGRFEERDAVLLVYGEDMSHAEAATAMNVSEKTVSWHLHEARKALRKKLEAAE